jgi:S1-C subfamily serine protease
VIEIVPGLSADTAGILPDDVIIAINEKPVISFNNLSDEIRKHTPGDKVVLDVLRNGTETLKIEVILGAAF